MNKLNTVRAPQNGARKLKNDLILIAALLAVAALASLLLLVFRNEGDTVKVSVDGKIVGEYSLYEDREVEIKSPNGYNLLVIEGGRARVARASCPDGICAAHRPISFGMQSIICLPNNVVIEVCTKNSENQPDIIVQ